MMEDILPGSAKSAKIEGVPLYFTGKPCKHGHISSRRTSTRACVECDRVYYQSNKKVVKLRSTSRYNIAKLVPGYQKQRYADSIENQKLYREKNKERRNAHHREWYYKNHDHALAYSREYNSSVDVFKKRKQARESYRRYKPRFIANVAHRRAAKLLCTPKWITEYCRHEIRELYKKRDALVKLTGISFHVDHIIPLQGVNVSGLHVPWNLQIIPACENLSKGNKLLPGVV